MKSSKATFVLAGSALLASCISLNAMVIYAGPPEEMQATNLPAGTFTVETFNDMLLNDPAQPRDFAGDSSIGQYTWSGDIRAGLESSAFSAGPGEGRFLNIRAVDGTPTQPSVMTLALESTANYFGFAWLAADPFNSIEFFRGSDLIFSLNTPQLTDLFFDTATLEAIDGQLYDVEDYYGRPGSDGEINPSEFYVFLHFLASPGQEFDTIVFNQPSTSTNFESDNHTVGNLPVEFDPPGDWVEVPEPSAYAVVIGILALGVVATRRRRK